MRVGFNLGRVNREKLLALLEGLIALNRLQIRRSPRPIPALYGSGVRYQREARKRDGTRKEEWRTIAETLKHGSGDCEDLCGWRVAELREQGINASPWVTRHGSTWHVRVRHPDGKLEDPSARLGMGAV